MGNNDTPQELRIVIRYANARKDDARLIPASVFKRTFDAMFEALNAANKELGAPCEIVIKDLKIGSNEAAFAEIPKRNAPPQARGQATAMVEKFAKAVVHGDFMVAQDHPKLARCLVKLGKAYDKGFSTEILFGPRTPLTVDSLFQTQTKGLARAVKLVTPNTRYFAGTSYDSYQGVLGEIDYTGSVWKGQLILSPSKIIECQFDRSKGEDAYNKFGNKRVEIMGLAIYTGESLLPARIEALKIKEIPAVTEPLSIKGVLAKEAIPDDWSFDLDRLQ